MQISQAGLAFIERFEGFRDSVYLDAGGRPTIGFGHLLKFGESFPQGITDAQGRELLLSDVQVAETAVNRLMDPSCNQNRFDALCSFAFNLGAGPLRAMLMHGWDHVPVQMARWVYVGGKECPGLLRRRKAEAELFTASSERLG